MKWFRKIHSLKGTLSGLRQYLAAESPLKMMKNDLYSRQKVFSFSRYLSFCFDFFVNGLIRKIRLISNFMASHPEWKTIVIHIMTIIWRIKGNQTITFGQLIGYNLRNIFLEKPYTKCGGETSPRPFFEKLKFTISLNQKSKVCFYCMLRWGLSKYIETALQTTCLYLHIKLFWKIEKRSGTSLSALFFT